MSDDPFAPHPPENAALTAMEQRERFLQKITEITPGVLHVFDLESQSSLFINRSVTTLLGYTPEEVNAMGRAVTGNLMHPDDQGPFEAHLERLKALDDDEYADFEHRMRDRAGQWRWFHSRDAVFARDESGAATQIIGNAIDITARKQAEATLAQSAALFTRLVEQAPMGMYVVDAEFRLQQVNALAAPVFANIKPLIGRDFDEVMEILWGPQVGAQCSAIFRRTLATGESYVSPPFSEQRFDLSEEQTFDWQTQRVALPDGQRGVVCYFHEITEKARAERALRQSEERMRLATTATGVGIWEWNVLTGQIRWDEKMFSLFGFTPTPDGFIAYEQWRETVQSDDLVQLEATFADALSRRVNCTLEFRIRRADNGELRHILAGATIRANAQGQAEWVVGTNLDVTERRRMEEALRDADRRKDEFLATLAHELRNPMFAISGAVELVSHVEEAPETLPRLADILRRQTRQMNRLIDDLLDVSRIGRGKVPIRLARVELVEIVRQALETSHAFCQTQGHEIEADLPDAPIFLEGDGARLIQVVGNVLNNACKFTDRGGHIRLSLRREAGEAVIRVRDNGIGIDPEQLPRLFGLFTQADTSLHRPQAGLGIGLSLAKNLIELHGGRIEAHSEGIGQGSEFVLRLPLPPEPDATPVQLQREPDSTPNAAQRSVLVVDDNVDAAWCVAQFLEAQGHRILLAHNGAEALEKVRDSRPDVVLLDIGLPHLDGYEVCRRIREADPTPRPTLIALTGWGQEADRRQSSAVGFDAHLLKPVDFDQLKRLLERV